MQRVSSGSHRQRVIGWSFEPVVGVERVRAHRRIAVAHVLGQQRTATGGGWPRWLLAPALQRQAHGVGMRHVARQRLEDGGLQLGGAVAIEQAQQRRGDRAQVGAARGGAREQVRLAGAACARRSVARCWRAARLCSTSACDMGGVLDLRAAVLAAPMAGEDRRRRRAMRTSLGIGQHRQGAPHMGVRDGVVVQVEADIGRLADRAPPRARSAG